MPEDGADVAQATIANEANNTKIYFIFGYGIRVPIGFGGYYESS